MNKTTRIGLVLILIGICLPTATMPFITQFKPVPELCLTSNFFQNLGNMIVVFGSNNLNSSVNNAGLLAGSLSMPYRYLFSSGIILSCIGAGIIVLFFGNSSGTKH